MNYVKLNFSGGSYSYVDSSSIGMFILGIFLTSDVGCYWPSFKDFALNANEESTNSNVTYLEKENGFIFLSDLYSEEDNPTRLKISIDQYITLLDNWQEKVCKHKPKEVIIKEENGRFMIETKD